MHQKSKYTTVNQIYFNVFCKFSLPENKNCLPDSFIYLCLWGFFFYLQSVIFGMPRQIMSEL